MRKAMPIVFPIVRAALRVVPLVCDILSPRQILVFVWFSRKNRVVFRETSSFFLAANNRTKRSAKSARALFGKGYAKSGKVFLMFLTASAPIAGVLLAKQ
jgi:hypothetical protein